MMAIEMNYLPNLDGNSGKMTTGRIEIRPRAPTKPNNMELISVIAKSPITGYAAHERQCSEVIQTVKTLKQLTPALRGEIFDLQRSSVDVQLKMLLKMSVPLKEKDM